METVQDLVTDKQVNEAWGNADFGSTPKRKVIADTLLKCASGYETGKTARCIAEDLGLVTQRWELSKRGQRYLYAAFRNGADV